MKKIFILIIMFAALNCFGQPKIQFENLTHDFGKQAQNAELKHIFTFKNTGTGTLLIEKITAGWGCTGVLLSKKDIPAGGSGEIEVTLKTGTHKGKLNKTVTVNTNDKTQSNLQLVLKVEVQ